jgi:2-methylcitrate dehydratase PrpD
LEGPQALLPMSADLLGRPQIASFARKVSLQNDSEIESAFPSRAGARLVVHSNKGFFHKTVEHPRGDPANPFSPADIKAKFYTLAAVRMGRDRADEIVKAVLSLTDSGLDTLSSALKGTER